MARKKQEFEELKELSRWKSRIAYTKEYTENATRKRGLDNFLKYYRGDYEDAIDLTNVALTVVNEVYAYVKTCISSLYFRDPYISINPIRDKDVIPAVVQEQAINYEWRKLKIKRQAKRCVEEAKIIGRSWIKIGYYADFAEYESEVEDEVNQFVSNESLFAVRVLWTQILYDSNAIDPPYDCRWIAHCYSKETELLRKKYGIEEIKATTVCAKDKEVKAQLQGSDTEKSLVYEIWDKDSGRKLVYTDGWNGGFLENISAIEEGCIGPYKLKGFPFFMLKFNMESGARDNFPLSAIEIIEPQILEKIKLRSIQLNHLKRWNRQMAVKSGTVKQEEQDKFAQNVDGGMFFVDGNPSECLQPTQYPPLSPDIYNISNSIDMDRDRISGQSQIDQGGAIASKTRTLGELNQIAQATSNRRMEETDVLEDFCEEISHGLISLQRQFYDVPKYAAIIGEIPQAMLAQLKEQGLYDGRSIQFDKETIQCDYDLDIKIGSTQPLDKSERMQRIMTLIKYGPSIGLTPTSNAGLALGKAMVEEMELKDVEIAYEKDLQELAVAKEQAKQSKPADQFKMAKMQQDLKKGAVDTQLKSLRTQRVGQDVEKTKIENQLLADEVLQNRNGNPANNYAV